MEEISWKKEYQRVLNLLSRPIGYSDRAREEMKQARFTEEMLLEILKYPRKVHFDGTGYSVHGRKTAKIKLKITEGQTVFIESFRYNQVPFIF